MSTYQLEIDATGAESGSRRIVKSFEDIKAAAAKMEQGASGSFSKMTDAFRSLNNMRSIRSETLRNFREFFSAISGFRGPSAATMENTRKFFNMLGNLSSFRAPSSAGLRGLLEPLAGYKGPSQAAAKNTAALLRAFNGFSPPRVSGSFTGFLTSLSAFRGPPPTAGRNTISFLNAISNFSAPKGLSAATRQFIQLAESIDRAARSMSGLRGGSITFPAPTGRQVTQVREFGRGFIGLETAILRSQTALNSLGGILGIKFLAEASNNIVKIKSQLEAATGSAQQARVQFQFVAEQANSMGLEFTTVAKSYGMLLGSIKGTNVTFDEAQQIFKGFSTAARALQLSTDDVDGVFRALGQIMSKGKLQAEELRGQLGDRLPGAFVRFARALDMTKPGQLDDALKKGAISGDKLKKAILEVATTMEVEFAESAGKASKTVDSAFNRLKNSFTFSAAEFGNSGFNEALKNLADALRNFLESDSFNTAMFGVAKVLKMVSENIELVAAVAGGVGAAAFLKMIATSRIAIAVFGSWVVAMRSAALGSIAMAAATGNLTKGMAALNLVMKINPWIILGTAIAGLIYWYSQATSASEKMQKELMDSGRSSATAANILDAYTARIADNSGSLDTNTEKLRRNTLAKIANQQAAYGETDFGLRIKRFNKGDVIDTQGYATGGRGGVPKITKTIAGTTGNYALDKNGKPITGQTGSLLAGVAGVTGVGGRRAFNAAEFGDLAKANVRLGYALKDGQIPEQYREMATKMYESSSGYIEGIVKSKQVGANMRYDPESVLGGIFGDYNKNTQPPGISGDVPEKPPKGDKSGKKGFESDIDRAVRAFNELDEKIRGSRSSLQGFLTSSTSALAAQARAAAVDKVSDLENGFEPAKRVSGIMAVAKAMNLEAKTYEQAKAALVGKYAAQEEASQRAQNDLNVGRTIADLREENRIRGENIAAIATGGSALNRANIEMQVQKELLNGSAEARDVLTQKLTEQLEIQQKLNQAEEVANAIRDSKLQLRNDKDALRGYGMGLDPAELDRYRELTSYMNEMRDKGYDAGTLSFLENLKRAQQTAAAALKSVADEYEAIRQMSQDQADAIVDSLRSVFEEGYSEGKKFFDRIGDLFKNLRGILLNFLVYNPLRDMLTNSLQGLNTKAFGTSGKQTEADAAQKVLKEVQDQGRLMLEDVSAKFSSESPFGVATYNLGGSAEKLSNAAADLSNAAASISGGGVSIGAPPSAIAPSAVNGPVTFNDMIRQALPGTIARITSDAASKTGEAVAEATQVNVVATRETPPAKADRERRDYFSGLKKVFDYKTNFGDLKSSFGDIKSAFSSDTKGLGKKFDAVGKGIGKAAGVAAQAYGAFELGRGVGKTLGLGRTGSNALGGAAAGFSVGGPVGAAVGAALGIAGSILFSKSKKQASANIVVGENGRAGMGSSMSRQGGDLAAAEAAAGAGAGMFNQIATQLDSYLRAGDYGRFGEAKLPGKGSNKFYSVSGAVNKKGQPTGQQGVDWIASDNESELQAFALRSQIKAGKFADLNPVYMQIAQASSAKTMEDFSSDLSTGKSFIDFIDAAKIGSDLQKQVDALTKSFTTLKRSSAALGLDTNKLTRAYDKQMKLMRENFNYDINQQILQIKDPMMAAYNDLIKDYENAVGNAQAVGGDLAKVEELYGLKRKKLLEEYLNTANNGIAKAAQDLLTSLTASPSSPLSASKVLANSQTDYNRLKGEITSGDYTNVGDLQTYVQNYLDAARTMFRSSGEYFDIFKSVTDFLRQMEGIDAGSGGATNAGNLPTLPGIDAIIEKLSHQNDDLKDVTQAVGAAIVDGNNSNEQLLTEILHALNRLGGSSAEYVGTSGPNYGLLSNVNV